MTAKRIFLEVGTGNDWHGRDYTKAAIRAVQDAIHHSSLTLFRTLAIDPATMDVDVTIAVQQPDKVDRMAIQKAFPHGRINVDVVKGGLDIPEAGRDDLAVIANAAIAVRLDLAAAAGQRGSAGR